MRNPVREGEVDGGQRRHVELLDHRPQLRIDRLAALRCVAPHDAYALHRAEQHHDHKIAGAEFPFGRKVSVSLVERESGVSTGTVFGALSRRGKPVELIRFKKRQVRRRHCATLADARGECNALVRRDSQGSNDRAFVSSPDPEACLKISLASFRKTTITNYINIFLEALIIQRRLVERHSTPSLTPFREL